MVNGEFQKLHFSGMHFCASSIYCKVFMQSIMILTAPMQVVERMRRRKKNISGTYISGICIFETVENEQN